MSFRFKQFTVCDEHSAMKVGTDGTLLGAWTEVPPAACRILDIGSGCGLCALILAQRAPGARIEGVEIDRGAILDARANAARTPYKHRLTFHHADIRHFQPSPCVGAKDCLPQPRPEAQADEALNAKAFPDAPADKPQTSELQTQNSPYALILSNPPFFTETLAAPDAARAAARSTSSSLTFAQLLAAADRLLAPHGTFALILPHSAATGFIADALAYRLYPTRRTDVLTSPRKPPRRTLLQFARGAGQPCRTDVLPLYENKSANPAHPTLQLLARDFYL